MKKVVPPSASFPILGRIIDLRLVGVGDARFIHSLRTDAALSKHLSVVEGKVEDQQVWLERYKAREASGDEFYFVVMTKAQEACGLVRLYDVAPPRFTWGSVILGPQKPPKAALETALLSMNFGFDTLGCDVAQLDVRRTNSHAIAFYRRFGMRQVGEDEIDLFFELTRDDFEVVRPVHESALASAGA